MLILHANNKCADQPAHPHRLISAFVIHYLKSKVGKLADGKGIALEGLYALLLFEYVAMA